jgi:hypothetical protein
MEIQTEEDFCYGSLKLEVVSNWRTDSSIGFEKWYGRDRYSIVLQGNGYVWIRWRGRLWEKRESFLVNSWRQLRKQLLVLHIDWEKATTIVGVNGTEVCCTKTRVHRPLNVRLNADLNDFMLVTDILWPET